MSAYLAQQFGVIPMAKRVLLLAQEDKCYEKAVKFYPEIFEVKVSCDKIIKTIGLILLRNMSGVTIVLFFFYC